MNVVVYIHGENPHIEGQYPGSIVDIVQLKEHDMIPKHAYKGKLCMLYLMGVPIDVFTTISLEARKWAVDLSKVSTANILVLRATKQLIATWDIIDGGSYIISNPYYAPIFDPVTGESGY